MVLFRVLLASMASAAGIVVQCAEDWAASNMDAFSLLERKIASRARHLACKVDSVLGSCVVLEYIDDALSDETTLSGHCGRGDRG